MNRKPPIFRNLWALTVLSFLRERPLHPYEMQRLIRERHKDDLLDLKRGSLYHAIGRLEKAGLIEAVDISREGRRPERTTYRLTDEGLDVLLDWLHEMLSRPSRDPNEFLAALSHLAHLTPEEATDCLVARTVFLEAEIAGLESVLRTTTPLIGRLLVLETDMARAWKQAELEWVRHLVDDLRNGVHQWDIEELIRNAGTISSGPHGSSPEGQEVDA
ncbi:MAG: PadR family transcriptional regulator [Chloroflexota bacterium]|nr:PadR family transcriptional regulator [Chloroflexota bacterium]